MSLYFAYGSNMSHAQMQRRCPGAKFMSVVRLDGYKFVYDGWTELRQGPVGNIIPDETSFVLGGLYEISDENIKALDAIEMSNMDYLKSSELVVHDMDDKEYTGVIAYWRLPEKLGTPTDDYRNIILKGAKDCGLPADYIAANL